MRNKDDGIIEGKFADEWIEWMGKFGDPIRTAIVNPIVAHVASHFTETPITPSTRTPRNVFQVALSKVRADVSSASFNHNWTLTEWHENKSNLAKEYPSLRSATIWDLGCGEGYLSRWLAEQGATCVGVEPSERLSRYAKENATTKTTIVQATIDEFMSQQMQMLLHPRPTLITIIAVLDAFRDLKRTLDRLSLFLSRHAKDVPVLIATFDPDYFCHQLPRRSVSHVEVMLGGKPRPLVARDPAEWERLLSESNFHVLDQRPIHLDLLPSNLCEYIVELCHVQTKFQGADVARPRQGPFYFWLTLPRSRKFTRAPDPPRLVAPRGAKGLRTETLSFDQNEIVEVPGNIGSRVYEVLKGCAYFPPSDQNFKEQALFGQMEINQNYVAARLLGPIVAKSDLIGQSFSLARVKDHLKNVPFSGQLFLSMMGYFDSESFKQFINAKYATGERSKVMPSLLLTQVRNCAAIILNAGANQCSKQFEQYTGRLLLELSYKELQKAIYQDDAFHKGMKDDLALQLLVQNSAVDCFSAKAIQAAQDDVSKLSSLARQGRYLHLGWIVAAYLRHILEPEECEMRLNAIAISAFLGHPDDDEVFLPKRDKEQTGLDPDLRASHVNTAEKFSKYIANRLCVESGHVNDDLSERLSNFLLAVREEFNFKAKPQPAEHFSRFIVIRDIWALLACVLDSPNMWSSDGRTLRSLRDLAKTPQLKHRLISYFYECVAHIGEQCGLVVLPGSSRQRELHISE